MVHPLTDCIRLTEIAPAKCQQTRYRSEFTAASRGFPATAWLSCMLYAYWYVKKLRSRPIGLKTQKMSLTIIKFIGDELIKIALIFSTFAVIC